MKPRDPLPKELFHRASRDGENYTRPGDNTKTATDPAGLIVENETVLIGRYTLAEELEVSRHTSVLLNSLTKPTGKKAK